MGAGAGDALVGRRPPGRQAPRWAEPRPPRVRAPGGPPRLPARHPARTTPQERERHERWKRVLRETYDLLCDLDDAGRRDPVLDTYGAEDEAECFAVATEAFFERRRAPQAVPPRALRVLSEYYQQDPAVRMELGSWRAEELEQERIQPAGKPKGLGKKGEEQVQVERVREKIGNARCGISEFARPKAEGGSTQVSPKPQNPRHEARRNATRYLLPFPSSVP